MMPGMEMANRGLPMPDTGSFLLWEYYLSKMMQGGSVVDTKPSFSRLIAIHNFRNVPYFLDDTRFQFLNSNPEYLKRK